MKLLAKSLLLLLSVVCVCANVDAAGSKRSADEAAEGAVDAKRHEGSTEFLPADASPEDIRKMWFAAVDAGDLDRIQYCMERKGVTMGRGYLNGWTALHDAARHGHLPVVKYFVSERGINPYSTREGYTALHEAAMEGHTPVARWLVEEAGVDPHWRHIKKCLDMEFPGPTVWGVAVGMGHLPFVKYLVQELHFDVDEPVDACGCTALYRAVGNGRLETAQFLVQAGADVNKADDSGWSPLHVAAFDKRENVFDFLLSLKDSQTGDLVCKWKRGTEGIHRSTALSLLSRPGLHEDQEDKEVRLRMQGRIKKMVIDGLTEQDVCGVCRQEFDLSIQEEAPKVFACCTLVLCAHDTAVLQAQDDPCPQCKSEKIVAV